MVPQATKPVGGAELSALACAALVLAVVAGGCATSCPAGLLPGVLVADGSDLRIRDDAGLVRQVMWPSGYSVRPEGDLLVVTDLFGSIKAREGERVALPGGEASSDGPWRFCGSL